jgi:hypothetical protein
MSTEDIEQARELFGAAPILTSEEPERFEKFFLHLATSIQPRDFTELLLIWHFTCESWSLSRYTRHAAVAVDRRYQESLLHQAQRAKLQETRRLSQNRNTFANAVPADIAGLATLEENVLSVYEDVDEILKRKTSELDDNRALQGSIVFQEQLDRLIISATRRRDDTLTQLETYRAGLGAQASAAAEQILDGEFQEVAPVSTLAPILAPPDQEPNDDAESTNTTIHEE